MTQGIIVSPANRGVQVVVTDENNVQLLIDSNRGVNLEIVPQPRIEVLVDKGVEGAQGPVGPQGPQGPQGTAATVTAGTTTTGLAGTNAIVTNSGTSSAAVFDFTIPRGDTGATGAGVATGGTTGQFLQKASNANYDTTWATITGTLVYQGSWNASTNTPTLTSSVGTNGYYYVVGTSGSTNLNGITDWVVGDWAIFNGSVWQKIDNTDLVSSVNGQTGVVVLNAADVGALSTLTSTDGSVTITSPNSVTRDLSVAVAGSTTNVLCLVRNTTGAILTKGTVVYISGATGQNPTVSKALATSDATSAQTLGMMTADLANNSNGYVTVIGLITNIDTSAYTDGQQLYLSGTTAGTVTGTKPYAPIHLVYVAVVEHAHPTQGKLFVKVQNGYELDEIHNVSAQTPSNGQTIVYNSTTQLWENNTVSLGIGVNGTLPVANGGTGATTLTGYVKGSGTTPLTASATIPSGDITGLGTMAIQNANAVAITGGAIDNTTIGATTPSTGVFTTLTATGQTDLGGPVGNPVLKVFGSTPIQFIDVEGSTTGTTRLRSWSTNASSSSLLFQTRATGNFTFATGGSSGNVQAFIAHTTSAVNYVQVTGAATLVGGPTISAQGSDFNIPLRLQSKGISAVEIGNPAGWAGFAVTTTNNPNRIALNAPATGFIPTFSTAGVDTNAGMAFISKGTGAIDLAAGSSGVNISNGGTVTAITPTAAGSGYTSVPSCAISAPTTAGGVQATGGPNMGLSTVVIASGGSGYTVGDVLTLSGGTGTAATVTVATLSGSAVATVTITTLGAYTVLPTNPVTLTGGTGSGATLTVNTYAIRTNTFNITNAGSGYVEQPTVTFSGGGGSGAAAYATVGSGTVVKSIGSTMDFYTANAGVGFRIADSLGTGVNYWQVGGGYTSPFLWARGSTNTNGNITSNGTGNISIYTNGGSQLQFNVAHTASAVNYVELTGAPTVNAPTIGSRGSDSNINFAYSSKGTGGHDFYTAGTSFSRQFTVAHTASAVNYVQVTGAATGGRVTISSQGSDANVPVVIGTKGSGSLNVRTNDSATTQFAVTSTASAVNYINVTGATTTNAPVLSALGSDTNIPLVLQPKGTGALQAQQTDSTATGGNARGANAVDWQMSRGGAAQVASSSYSVISGGIQNTSSAYGTVICGGLANTSSGTLSFVGGGQLNQATRDNSVVVGGSTNTAVGIYNFIGGGFTNTGTANAAVTTQSATMNGTTAVTLAASNASIKVGQYISGTSIASDTYVAAVSGTSLTLSKNASGSSTSTLSFFTPHGVVVGGGNNQATGSYSFIGGGGDAGTAANRNVASGDWSVVAGGTKNTASGIGSFIGGGGTNGGSVFPNTASGIGSVVVGGFSNTASGFGASILGGNSGNANASYSAVLSGLGATNRGIDGAVNFNASIASVAGDAQCGIYTLRKSTTDATASVLTCNGNAAGTTNQVILPNNSAYAFRGEIVSGVTGGGNSKSWTIEGLIKRGANAASTTLVGSTVTSMYADAGAVTWTIALSADTTNGGLAVTFTGQAATTIRTVCRINTVEMTY